MRLLLCLILHLAVVGFAHAEERYFVTLYASQRSGREPQHTHSFAVFIRVTPEGESNRCEKFTISWMPAGGVIRLIAPPEPGKNYTLEETLDWAARLGLRTRTWGPFEIAKETYDLALEQKHRLESGQVLYKALDRRHRPHTATNCIHAVSDVLPGPLLSTGSAAGDSATAMIVAHYRPHLIDPEQVHRWVLQAAGLENEGDASTLER
jgi:hypothetical protein